MLSFQTKQVFDSKFWARGESEYDWGKSCSLEDFSAHGLVHAKELSFELFSWMDLLLRLTKVSCTSIDIVGSNLRADTPKLVLGHKSNFECNWEWNCPQNISLGIAKDVSDLKRH